jgi:hypothetical protein
MAGEVYVTAALEKIAVAEQKLMDLGFSQEKAGEVLTLNKGALDPEATETVKVLYTTVAASNGFVYAEVLHMVKCWVNRGDKETLQPFNHDPTDIEQFRKWMEEQAKDSGQPVCFLQDELIFHELLKDNYPTYSCQVKMTINGLLLRLAKSGGFTPQGASVPQRPH